MKSLIICITVSLCPQTYPDIPPMPPNPPLITGPSDPSSSSLTITLPMFSDINGPIRYKIQYYLIVMYFMSIDIHINRHYQVVVVILQPANSTITDLLLPDILFPSSNLEPYQESFCKTKFDTPKAYVTAEFASELLPTSRQFTVGETNSESPNDRPVLYPNGKLCYSTKYTFFLRAYPACDDRVSLYRINTHNTNVCKFSQTNKKLDAEDACAHMNIPTYPKDIRLCTICYYNHVIIREGFHANLMHPGSMKSFLQVGTQQRSQQAA